MRLLLDCSFWCSAHHSGLEQGRSAGRHKVGYAVSKDRIKRLTDKLAMRI